MLYTPPDAPVHTTVHSCDVLPQGYPQDPTTTHAGCMTRDTVLAHVLADTKACCSSADSNETTTKAHVAHPRLAVLGTISVQI